MPAESTESLAPEPRSRPRDDWTVIVAMDCQALESWPEAFNLGPLTEVSIARGTPRTFTRKGSLARLELPDRWVSQSHAQLVRTGDHWTIEDKGSRNGTRVNGERVTRKALGDGDIVECGGTFLVVRRTGAPTPRAEPLAECPEALRTMSAALEHEFSVLPRIARSPIPVLVLGETGTGKEGTVSLIHELSGRTGPLVAVNCGAIPATLIESELFGSRRGAFSGAEERVGLVRTAQKGTLFLDEMAELPLSSQAALLRVLQEKEILPLGTTRAIAVDVRVVAATNSPVAQLVEEGKLRRDLYARLRGYELRLPPLRERLEDMGLLVGALIRRHNQTGAPRTLSREAAWALFAHSWPLNIRELEQSLSSAVTLTHGEIGLSHLRGSIRVAGDVPRPASMHERERLLSVIEKHGGNLSAVARELGTSRSQLYRLMARHSIRPADAKRVAAKTS